MKIKYFEENNIDINNLDSCIYQPHYNISDKFNQPVLLKGIGRKFPQLKVKYAVTTNSFINFCIDGGGKLHLNNKTYDVTPGTCMVIAKGTPVEYYPVQDKFTTYWLSFGGEYGDKILRYKDTIFTLSDVNELIEEWYKIYNLEKNSDWLINSSALVYKFILKLNKQMSMAFEKHITASDNKLSAITEYLSLAISNPYSLEYLAKTFKLSPAHICRMFKKEFNMTPNEYFELQKINYAKYLLIDSGYSVGEISACCGYNDSNYFSYIFKKHIGISPTQYKKIHKNENNID